MVTYVGPIATADSNTQGQWKVHFPVQSEGQFRIPHESGFVFYRAESRSDPAYFANANVVDFALVTGGRRPNGAGAIRLRVSVVGSAPEELTFLAERLAGLGGFMNTGSLQRLPFETTIPRLLDGVYEVTAETASGLQPVVEGSVEEVTAPICTRPGCTGETKIFRVIRVTIQDGTVATVNMLLGQPGTNLPSTGTGGLSTSGSDRGIAGLLAGVGFSLVLLGWIVRTASRGRRRAGKL